MPKGLLMAGPDLLISKSITIDLTAGTTSSSTATGLALTAGYGITDELEIMTLTPTYAIGIDPSSDGKGPLDVGVGYKLLRGAAGGKLEVIARAVGGYDLAAEGARPLRVGVQVQYNATPKIAILSHDIGLGNAGVSIALAGDVKPVYLTIPVGVAYQALPNLWIEADTALASSIKISNGANAFINDITPVFATAIYNTLGGRLDVLGYVGAGDLQNAGDTLAFGLGARYYVGAL
jgi:hypothetical protein